MAERDNFRLAKVGVEGSNPFARSKHLQPPDSESPRPERVSGVHATTACMRIREVTRRPGYRRLQVRLPAAKCVNMLRWRCARLNLSITHDHS